MDRFRALLRSLTTVLLATFAVLWIATLLCGVAAYGVRPTRRDPSGPWPRWVGPSAGVAAVLLAVVLPVMAVVYSSGEREHLSHTGVKLTDEQVSGRELFASACKRCHTLADTGAASTIGPNLDALQPKFETIVDAVLNGRARGNGQMPAGLGNREDAEAVARYLEAVAGRSGRSRH